MSLCINPHCANPQNPDNVLFCQSCGSELLLAGRYRVTCSVGEGGFGKTYEVTSRDTIKVLKVLIKNSPKAVELFQREAQVLSQLNHPGIPKIESKGYFLFYPRNSQKPLHCLVMERIEGLNLRDYIQERGNRPIDGELALQWLAELVNILHEVHQQNICHRDIKPQNIMLKPDGHLALVDFGTVREGTRAKVTIKSAGKGTDREVAIHAVEAGTSIHSAGYTPLEQINGHAVPQSDFFALGRTFVFLLTGKEPLDESIYDAFNDELRWYSHACDVSLQLADLIDQMMARLPSQRPQSTPLILQQLVEMNHLSVPPQPIPKLPQPPPRSPLSPPLTHPKVFSGVSYTGFWQRALAAIIDSIILNIGFSVISWMVGFIYGNSGGIDKKLEAEILCFFLGILLGWLYYAILESSPQQATPGKMALGIIVTDMNGNKISFSRASGRYFSKLISTITLFIGYFMAGFTEKKQALHDIIASCLVVKKKAA
ncbi:MAG TPA: RDD family protein [Coleofasciculaceae cyanobacterium]|jgi:serine/threonine protein kinase